jgi:hypothetical protein
MPLLETRAELSAQGYGLFGATATGFFLIQQLTPSAVSTVTFSSIPSTYKSLQVRFNLVATSAGTPIAIQLNGDSTTGHYISHWLSGSGTTATAGGGGVTTQTYVNQIGAITTYPNVGIIDVIDYTNTNKNKTVKSLFGANQNTSAGSMEITSGLWLSTSAVTSLTVLVPSGTYTGTISLYGVS